MFGVYGLGCYHVYMKNKALYVIVVAICFIGIILGVSYFAQRQSKTVILQDKKQDISTSKNDQKDSMAQTLVSLRFAGDILPARAVELTMRKNGYMYPFEKIRQELADADITFANLESPLIGTKTTGRTTPGGTTVFRGDVDFATTLKEVGIDVVSLANNHMKDQGQKGIESTLTTLDQIGLKHAGAGLNSAQAEQLAVIEVDKGMEGVIKVGFLAFNDADVVPESYHATEKQSGTNIMDVDKLKRLVAENRPKVDVLIVSMHSGTEYAKRPNSKQITFAQTAIDAGADIVMGHHPHVLQPIQQYKGKYIFYSLGNFVFDQPWPDTKQSLIAQIDVFLKKDSSGKWSIQGQKPTVIPLAIYQFQPQKLVSGTPEYQAVLNRLDFPYKIFKIGGQVLQVGIASSSESREKGLSGTSILPKGQGLLFTFDRPDRYGIWMKDMKYPIDIYWFDKDFRLIDQALSVKPETYPNVFYPKADAYYVLETNVQELIDMSLTKDLTGELTDIVSYDKK